MKPHIAVLATIGVLALLSHGASARGKHHSGRTTKQHSVQAGLIRVPKSSIAKRRETGIRGHTNIEEFLPAEGTAPQPPPKEFYKKQSLPSSEPKDR